MGVVGRHIERAAINAAKWEKEILQGRYFFDSFMQDPVCFVKGTTLTEPAGTSLQAQMFFTGRYWFEYAYAGDVTDAFVPVLASEGGYNWLFTDVLGSGVEINFGGIINGNPRNHIPSQEDWFFRALLIADDASGLDAFVGFRKSAAYAATLTEYSDIVGVRILGASGSSDAAITQITNLNNAGSTDYTSTALVVAGLEDATAIELEVRSVGGRAFVYVNGASASGAIAYTYDSGDVMSPVIRLLQSTDVFAQAKTLCVEGGPLAYRRDATLLSLAGSTI